MAISEPLCQNNATVAKKTAPLLPSSLSLLRQFGERLRLARLRRRLAANLVAQRAGMAPMTLRNLERGGAGVTIGAYLSVMQVLGIEEDLKLLGQADPMGRELQDTQLPTLKKLTRSAPAASGHPATTPARPLPTASIQAPSSSRIGRGTRTAQGGKAAKPAKPAKPGSGASDTARTWTADQGFSSAESLAGLFEPASKPAKTAR